MKVLMLAATLALALAAPVSAADGAGLWIVDGNIENHTFTLYCTFAQDGETLTGACRDDTATGKAHPLTSGRLVGDQVAFTYQSNFLVLPVHAAFEGRISGSTMAGKATAVGWVGTFTAKRA